MKSEVHIAFILTLLANGVGKDSILSDKKFIEIIDDFNKLYRNEDNYITEQDVMDEMVKSKTYSYMRNHSSWWVITKLGDERYVCKDETFIDRYYIVHDTYLKKNVYTIKDRDYADSAQSPPRCLAHDEIKFLVMVMNEQFHAYNMEILSYVLNNS